MMNVFARWKDPVDPSKPMPTSSMTPTAVANALRHAADLAGGDGHIEEWINKAAEELETKV